MNVSSLSFLILNRIRSLLFQIYPLQSRNQPQVNYNKIDINFLRFPLFVNNYKSRLDLYIIYIISNIVGLQLLIIPEVIINGLNFSLECKANKITANINIADPSEKVVSCFPTNPFLNASCSNPAYIINEEANTVSMTKEATNVDQGEWKCTHTTTPPESITKSIPIYCK